MLITLSSQVLCPVRSSPVATCPTSGLSEWVWRHPNSFHQTKAITKADRSHALQFFLSREKIHLDPRRDTTCSLTDLYLLLYPGAVSDREDELMGKGSNESLRRISQLERVEGLVLIHPPS